MIGVNILELFILQHLNRSFPGFFRWLSVLINQFPIALSDSKRTVYGITPRNAEQTFAINAILNPEIKLISLQGVAGTGKTLLALAGALEQRKRYKDAQCFTVPI